MLEDTLTDRDL
ncbi:hypothetical protein AZE42_13703, partial [Rhizopogon vesiculosus]